MTRVWIDDQLHAHPKALAAWEEPRALGLHLLAMSYCGGLLTDGFVPAQWVREKLPRAGERQRVIGALVEVGLWEAADGGWRVHDFLDYQESRADVLDRRRRDRERKRGAQIPRGILDDSNGNPDDPSRVRPRERAGAAAGARRGVKGEASHGERADDAGARDIGGSVARTIAVLRSCERIHVERVGVENAIAAWPAQDPILAAREVVTWVSDPAFRTTNGAKLLHDALSRQQQRGARSAAGVRGPQAGMDQAKRFMARAKAAGA